MDLISCDRLCKLADAGIRGDHQQPKRRRVTHRASEAASFAQPPLSSNTAMFLAYKWDCGEYSAQKVQRIAALVKADILTAIESSSGCSVQNEKKNETSGFADLDALARLGLKGRFPKKKRGASTEIVEGRSQGRVQGKHFQGRIQGRA